MSQASARDLSIFNIASQTLYATWALSLTLSALKCIVKQGPGADPGFVT